MTSFTLIPHPATPPSDPLFKVWANVDHAAAFGATATTNIFFCVGAPASRFVMPFSADPARTNELWKTTCFEAFLRTDGEAGYQEWNFAPSGDWAAYEFSAYRQGMRPADVGAAPYIRMEDNLTWWTVGATIAPPAGQTYRLGLSAVLEEKDGTKSYWALAHAPGRPDFHAEHCFAATLA